jgi:hypothetical protein
MESVLSRFAPPEYVRPDWADAELAKSDAVIEAARLNAPRHSACYVSPYSVREPDGSVRELTQVELLAVIDYEAVEAKAASEMESWIADFNQLIGAENECGN